MKVGIFTSNAVDATLVKDELAKHHSVYIWRSVGNKTLDIINLRHLLDKIDVAYFDWVQTPFPEAMSLIDLGCKIVVRPRGLLFFYTYDKIPWQIFDAVIGHQLIKWKLQTLPDKQQPKVFHEIPAGTDVDFFTPPPNKDYGKNLVLHSTVIRFRKRVYTTIQTFYELLKNDPEWILHIVGQWEGGWRSDRRKEYFEPTQELIKVLNIESKIRLHDNLTPEEWKNFLYDMDIIISNGIREGTHISVLDAMCTGVYPLINCWLGADNYYPTDNIFYTQTELVEKIVAWEKLTSEKKQKLSMEMREWVKPRFDGKEIAVQVRHIIEEAGK